MDDKVYTAAMIDKGCLQVWHRRGQSGPGVHPPVEWHVGIHKPMLTFALPEWRLRRLAPYFSSTLGPPPDSPPVAQWPVEIQVVIPLWIPLVLVLPPTLWLWRVDRRRSRAGRCRRCKYDLAGLVMPVCPECGTAVAAAAGNARPAI